MYIQEDNGKLRLIDSDADMVQKTLAPGLYNIEIVKSMFGTSIHFQKNDCYKNNKVTKVGIYKEVYDFVEDYLSPEGKEVREAMHQQSRFGMLLEGDPGTGKSYLACALAEELVEKEKAICILTSNFAKIDFPELIDSMRLGNDPNQLIVFILDEFEKDYRNCNENALLGFLDGTNSRNNIITIATANDLSKLPSTILNRPGRFEKVVKFSVEEPEILHSILTNMLPEKYKDRVDIEVIFNIVKGISGITIDKASKILRDYLVNMLRGKTNEDIVKSLAGNKAYDKTIKPEDKEKKGKLPQRISTDTLLSKLYEYREDRDEDVDEDDDIIIDLKDFIPLAEKSKVA